MSECPPAQNHGAASGAPACPACGGHAWSDRKSWTSLRDCLGCGVVLNDRSASRQEEEARYQDRERAIEGSDPARARRRWRLAVRIAAAADGAPPSVLDVGCGAGEFLRVAGEAGARTAGIEIDPRAATVARAAGLTIAEGSIHDVAVPAGPWDLVTFWDVLDQIEDPPAALRAVLPRLRSGGVLLVRGRNGRLHAALKRAALRVRQVVPGAPDPAVVHRWGFGPSAWRSLLSGAGLVDIRSLAAARVPPALSPSILTFGRKPAA